MKPTSLFEQLACADVAVVQGGLSTTMELAATGRPFIYFPRGVCVKAPFVRS